MTFRKNSRTASKLLFDHLTGSGIQIYCNRLQIGKRTIIKRAGAGTVVPACFFWHEPLSLFFRLLADTPLNLFFRPPGGNGPVWSRRHCNTLTPVSFRQEIFGKLFSCRKSLDNIYEKKNELAAETPQNIDAHRHRYVDIFYHSGLYTL